MNDKIQINWLPFYKLQIQIGENFLIKENWFPPNWFVKTPSNQKPAGPFHFDEAIHNIPLQDDSPNVNRIKKIGHFETLKDSFRINLNEKDLNKSTPDRNIKLNFKNKIEGLVISPGNYCSANCGYCYAQQRFKDSPSNTTKFSTLNKSFEMIRNHPDIKNSCSITIGGGGDPTENFDFYLQALILAKKYKKLYELNIPVYISTLDPQFLKVEFVEVILKNQNWITLSIDGDPSTTFDRRKTNVKKLINIYPNCNWAASGVFTAKTAKHIAHNYEFLIDLGFNAIQIRPARLAARHPLYLTPSHFKTAIEQYNELINKFLQQRNLIELFSKLTSSDYLGRYFFRYLVELNIKNRCGAGLATLFVSPTEELFPCPSTTHKTVRIGSLNSTKLRNERIQSLHVKHPDCLVCNIFNVCGGPCTHESILLAEKPGELNVAICDFQRELCNLSVNLIQHLYQFQPEIQMEILHAFIQNMGSDNLL